MAVAPILVEGLPGGRKVVTMALNNHDQARIREYLLGKLDEAEQEQIEDRLLVEDDLFDELEASKDELVEEYCAGELDQAERRWFEEHFLATPEGRERHAFMLAMEALHAPALVEAQRAVKPQARPTFFKRLRDLLRTRPLLLVSATAMVLLISTASLMLLRPSPQHSLALTLRTSATERAPGEPQYPKVRLTPDVGELRISLQLDKPAPTGTTYQIELDDRANKRAIQPAARDANSVSVVIPTAGLRAGLYSLTLSAIDSHGEKRRVPGDYIFEITN